MTYWVYNVDSYESVEVNVFLYKLKPLYCVYAANKIWNIWVLINQSYRVE